MVGAPQAQAQHHHESHHPQLAPPARQPAEPHPTRRLRRDAVRGDQLLLLADRVQEAKRVRAEAHDRHNREQPERARGAGRHPHPLAQPARREHHKWQHQPGGRLHAHAHHEQRRGGAKIGSRARRRGAGRRCACPRGVCPRGVDLCGVCPRGVRPRGARRQQQRAREHEHHQRVVVRSPHRQLERHRVQADKHRRPLRRAPHLLRGARDQRHRAETGGHRDRLQRPQPTRQTQRRERVGGEREQRAVGRALKRPPHKREHGVGGRFGGHVRVGIKAVQHAQSRKRQVSEHVLGEQRRSQQQHHVRRHDRRGDRPSWERPRGEQHSHIARAHNERQRLEAARADPEPETVQRAIQPRRPTALAAGHIRCGCARRAGGHSKHARDHTHEPGDPERPQGSLRARGAARGVASVLRGRYAVHVAVPREHPPPCARPSRIVRQMGKA
jgi:hypothetical protein